ncbi:MAG: DUF4428 domain-containing protein [Eubacterium sp.]|nr:DUF4428 domain-containing protein [Eubacterium sp.]
MGLFDKKFCDVCGEKIGMLGNRKLDDGNLCKDCASKLSPFFSERRHSTVAEIKQQLEYRELNKKNLEFFNPTRILGDGMKVYIDDSKGMFVVSRRDYKQENSDLIEFSAVQNVRTELEEDRDEIYNTDADGNRVSYNPPRYEYKYELSVIINVANPYFNEIKFDVTPYAVDKYTNEFRRAEQTANEIVAALGGNSIIMQANQAMNNTPYANGAVAGGYAPQQPQVQRYNQQQQYQQQPQQYQQPQYQQQPQQQYQQPQQQQYQQQPQYQQPQQQYQQPQQQVAAAWFCPNCGTQNTGAFCASCGTPKQ